MRHAIIGTSGRPFNEARRLARLLLLASMILPAAASLAQAPPPAEAPEREREPVTLTAHEAQAAARLRGAWWLGRAVPSFAWRDFDPNGIPVLLVEDRPGHAPFALLMNHPGPPAGFLPALPAGDAGPAVLRSAGISLPGEGRVPPLFGGVPTALLRMGEAFPDGESGEATGEQVISRLLRQMAHVHQASKGLPADLVPPAPPAAALPPEVLALAAVEGRILVRFLYTERSRQAVLRDLAEQFVAVREARWALMGEAAERERRIELREGPAIFVEMESIRRAGQKLLEPPPIQEEDPGYDSFRYGLVPRVQVILGPLLAVPAEPGHLAARAGGAGAALASMLDRLGIDWLDAALRPETALHRLLAGGLGIDAPGQARALQRAREAFNYAGALRLAREREGREPAR